MRQRPSKALVVSPDAGSMTAEVLDKLRREFFDYLIIEFDSTEDCRPKVADAVVAGRRRPRDLGFVARALVDT